MAFRQAFCFLRSRPLAVCAVFVLQTGFGRAEATGPEVESLTGARTRLVWMRDMRDEDKRDKYGSGKRYLLMGFDSRDGRGVRPILDETASFFRPLITPDGEQIVFTDRARQMVCAVAWDGSNLREISAGVAGAVWQDSQGRIWVYGKLGRGEAKPDGVSQEEWMKKGPVVRYPLDDPSRVETVWSKSEGDVIPPGNLQLSAGGDAGSMAMPWPACGVAKFPDVAWIQNGSGCWPAIAPDRSYLSWIFDGSHRVLSMFDPFSARTWPVDLSQAPGFNGARAYHPRWSNHALLMTFTGPYEDDGSMTEPWPDVHIAKFLPDFSGMQSWLRITRSEFAEIFPDLWVDGGRTFSSAKSTSGPYPAALPGEKWPAVKDGLLFLWKNSRLGNAPAQDRLGGQPAMAALSGEAFFGPEYELVLRNGSARIDGYDRALAEGIKAAGAFSLEFVLSAEGPDQTGTHDLVSLASGGGRINFTVREERGQLVLLLRGSRTEATGLRVPLFACEPGRKTHVLVSYDGSSFACYANGRKVSGSGLEVGSLDAWNDDAKLVFGESGHGETSAWSGSIEGVAIYARALHETEASRHAALFRDILQRRPKRESWRVEAELVARRPAPRAEDIAPYRRALVVNRYKLTAGDLPLETDRTFLLAEWALLDGREPESFRRNKVGSKRALKLQRFDDHPQLQSERLISEPDEMDIYVEVAPWQQ